MLFKQKDLEKIKVGKITISFRNWKSQRVNKGSLVKTSLGLVKIEAISKIVLSAIKEPEARLAGFHKLEELQNILTTKIAGDIYRIELSFYGEDPRIKLREQSKLSKDELDEIKGNLKRLDTSTSHGPWTKQVLDLIYKNPKCKAAHLAAMMNKEKDWLKINIRKLKNLGLTISLEIGYTISPRGKAFLNLQ